MKKIFRMRSVFSILILLTLLASMTLAASAKEIRFTVLDENEEPFLDDYSEWGEQENMGVPSRFCDNDRYFVYKVTFDANDEYAFMSMNLGNAFVVEASVDNKKFELVLEDEGDTHDQANLKRYNIDLSKYLKDNESKTIYVQFLDKSPEDGWGIYTFGEVAFYSSSNAFEVTVLSTDKSVEAAANLLDYTNLAAAAESQPEEVQETEVAQTEQVEQVEQVEEVKQEVQETAPQVVAPQVVTVIPKTGDMTFVFIGLAAAALIGLVIVLKIKKKHNI